MTFCVRIFLIGFFVSLFFISCRPAEEPASITIIWHNNKAIGLSIPRSQLRESKQLQERLTIQLIKEGERSSVLGEFKIEDKIVLFEPLVPLTRGLRYGVLFDNSSLGEINIPNSETAAPALLEIYPTQDTLPENLLKIYLQFSQPMVEGRSLAYVTLLKDDRDTMKGTFLDLQPELWNNEGTVLTLWLDPGRAKRDLTPNKTLGAPLKKGERYTLHILKTWQSQEGIALTSTFKKIFITSLRDDQSPSPAQWKLKVPASGTTEPLEIDLIESLDYSLLNDAVQLFDADRVPVAGMVKLGDEESTFTFIPNESWKHGDYTLQIEGRLEDLAGNNLNRPFDRDLSAKNPVNDGSKFLEIRIIIY